MKSGVHCEQMQQDHEDRYFHKEKKIFIFFGDRGYTRLTSQTVNSGHDILVNNSGNTLLDKNLFDLLSE